MMFNKLNYLNVFIRFAWRKFIYNFDYKINNFYMLF